MLLQALSKPAGRAASFSASPAQADSQQPDSPSVSALKQSMLRVQPHALDNHVPALCGPLQASHHQALCVCMGLGHFDGDLGICESDCNLLCCLLSMFQCVMISSFRPCFVESVAALRNTCFTLSLTCWSTEQHVCSVCLLLSLPVCLCTWRIQQE